MTTVRKSAWEVVPDSTAPLALHCFLCRAGDFGEGLTIETAPPMGTVRLCPVCVRMIRDLAVVSLDADEIRELADTWTESEPSFMDAVFGALNAKQ